jgi:outer membrane protein OmpA-like peptidoglycan-associated protein
MDDIYAFRALPKPEPKPLPPPPVFLTGCVKDKTTLLPIPMATVFLTEDGTGEVLILKSNQEGCFKTPVKKGVSYTVKAMKTGYISDCFPFSFAATEPANDLSTPRPLLLDQLAVARVFKIEDIYYDFDKWNIRPDAEPPLNTLVNIMNENPITVELGSHTDCRGSDAYNEVLSQKRAESAVNYIISKGISSTRITAKGYGESQPVNKCVNGVPCSAAEHQANRRTECRVISTGTLTAGTSFDPDRFKEGEKVRVHLLPDGFFENCK